MVLAGKVAVVTGAAGGIGRAVVEQLIESGARVAAVDLRAPEGFGPAVLPLALDVTDERSAAEYVARAQKAFGPVTLAVLNAGITGPIDRIEATPVAAFDRVMATNVRSVWLGLAALLPAMRATGGGSIVATSSTAGLRGAARLAAYSASKHAVIGLVQSAALEAARDGIRVNAVCPGPIDTGMIAGIEAAFRPDDLPGARRATAGRIPLGRLGTPAEIARFILFLLGDGADFATGGAYRVDGGALAGLVG